MKEFAAGRRGGWSPSGHGRPVHGGDTGKPVIAAVNGFAMGGGFMLVERTDLRVAVREAGIRKCPKPKRWLLGGYNHGQSPTSLIPSRWKWRSAFVLLRTVLRGGIPQPIGVG